MVSSYTELLAEHYKDKLDEKAEKYIHYTIDGAKRMQQLVKDLLAYSRVDSQAKTPTIIKSEIVVQDVLGRLKVAIEEVTHRSPLRDCQPYAPIPCRSPRCSKTSSATR